MDILQQAAERFRALQTREQLALAGLGGFLLVVIAIYGLWMPSHVAAKRAEARFANGQEILRRMEVNVPLLQANAGRASGQFSGSVAELVKSASSIAGINRGMVSHSEGDNREVVQFSEVSFNSLAVWINQVETHSATIESGSIDAMGDSGVVNATLTVVRH